MAEHETGVKSNPELVVDFSPNGQASALHVDQFSLRFLGAMSLERASEIEFDALTQKFTVTFSAWKNTTGIAAFTGFDGYDVARAFEALFLQYMRHWRLNPETLPGLEFCARHVRRYFDDGVRSLRAVPSIDKSDIEDTSPEAMRDVTNF